MKLIKTLVIATSISVVIVIAILTFLGSHWSDVASLAIPYPSGITFISFKTGYCFEGCPVYSFEIMASDDQVGTLKFNGEVFTCADGPRTTTYSREKMDELKAEIEQAGFLEAGHPFEVLPDAQSYTMDISLNGRRNIIRSYFKSIETPDAIKALAERLNGIEEIQDWLYGCPESERLRELDP